MTVNAGRLRGSACRSLLFAYGTATGKLHQVFYLYNYNVSGDILPINPVFITDCNMLVVEVLFSC